MKKRYWALSAAVLAAAGLLFWRGLFASEPTCDGRSSAFGVYCGYTAERFDGYVRQSFYIDLPSGARIAVDVLRPSNGGLASEETLPALFQHTIYNRAMTLVRDGDIADAAMLKLTPSMRAYLWAASLFNGGNVIADQARARPWIARLLRHGYVIVAADASGTGASYGAPLRSFGAYAAEARQIIDWIVRQEWSDGTVAMYGQSFTAMMAVAAAAEGHPALKAVYGASVSLDSYRSVGYRGGIRDIGFGESYVQLTSELDTLATPVDGENGGALLASAQRERHGQSFSMAVDQLMRSAPFIDSLPTHAHPNWGDLSLHPLLGRLAAAKIPIYLETGWNDIFTRDTLLTYFNLEGPRRIMIRPWHHRLLTSPQFDIDPGIEAHRWFDYWVKGVENGIVKENEIHFAVLGAADACPWRSAAAWPSPEQTRAMFHLGAARALAPDAGSSTGADTLIADLTATTGVDSRWNGVLGEGIYSDLAGNDAKGLSFTTAPFDAPVLVAGHPLVRLWVTSAQDDADVVAYLEDVSLEGHSSYVSEGALRLSHWAAGDAPYRHPGLSIHAHTAMSISPIRSGETAEIAFDLQPVARVFPKGHRLRITVQLADRDNLDTRTRTGDRIDVHWGPETPSHIEIPMAPYSCK